ncbi:MAG TPA: hypothetical protein VIO94_13650 [Phenylobacterium sp.]
MPDRMAGQILGELTSMGVSLGRDYWRLRHAVSQLGSPQFRLQSIEALNAERFGNGSGDD